jgi:hypothetical protein
MMAWRDGAAAQYNHVLSIMKDTMDKTLFVIDRLGEEERQLAYPIRDLHLSTKNYPSSPLEISSIHVAVVSLSCTLRPYHATP